jgi:integrase
MNTRRLTVTGTRQEAQKVETRLREELVKGKKPRSLKIGTFGEALTYYRDNTDADLTRVQTYFNRLIRELGAIPLHILTERFSSYWKLLKEVRGERSGERLSNATRNRLLMYGKVALNFCFKRGMIQNNPLVCFEKLPEKGRDRILTPEEAKRILEVMENSGSYLYWPFYFSLRNPIRRGDLEKLTRDNLNWFKPWVHFYPSKTRNRKSRETCLPFIDAPILNYFKSLPVSCNLLFPRKIDNEGNVFDLGDFKKHWREILTAAKVEDFRWHDLKHCAITWMLDSGYSERDLKNLGIQYSPTMIDRYYHADANKVLTKWKTRDAKAVASFCGLLTDKTA